uniref:Putative secreted protein n=1 Tax=Anopheles marajoara TaxID=58244 RepID=A0A2M4CC83_9DIPT
MLQLVPRCVCALWPLVMVTGSKVLGFSRVPFVLRPHNNTRIKRAENGFCIYSCHFPRATLLVSMLPEYTLSLRPGQS